MAGSLSTTWQPASAAQGSVLPVIFALEMTVQSLRREILNLVLPHYEVFEVRVASR